MKESNSSAYQITTLIWTLVFLIVGVFFLCFPGLTGSFITQAGNLLGFTGTISTSERNLWWVLSLSLMSAVTALAWFCFRHPQNVPTFVALLTAKLVSTACFAALALVEAPVWWTCAFADGFVALTLIITRSFDPSWDNKWRRRFIHQRPFYEIWYGKLNLGEGCAFWFRYTILNGNNSERAVWSAYFEKDKVIAEKNTLNGENISDCFDLGENYLSSSRAVGASGSIKWNLKFAQSPLQYDLIPAWLKLMMPSGYLTCMPSALINGTLDIAGRSITVDTAPGMMGHIWGKKMPRRWAWAHADFNHAGSPAVFEALSADVNLGGFNLPRLSVFALSCNNTTYHFNSLRSLLASESKWDGKSWSFKSCSRGATLEGTLTHPDYGTTLLRYTDTDGTPLYCHNSKCSNLELRFSAPDGSVTEFQVKGIVAFEIVERECPADVSIAAG